MVGDLPALAAWWVWPVLRPRRARCRSCLVTHVLLPVTALLRRAYAAEQIWMSLLVRAAGSGIADRCPAQHSGDHVRGYMPGRRPIGGDPGMVPVVAVQTGIDVAIPDGRCCGWGDVVAAVEAAVAAPGQRFGPVGLVGAVTPAQVMVAVTGGRLLAPDWPTMR